jgi:hypothetical protein
MSILDQETLDNLRHRTDAKLRYAESQLGMLKALGACNGSDDERSLQESFLFHLFGAKDAFLTELDRYYGGKQTENCWTLGSLREALKGRGLHSKEVANLYSLETDKNSWLFHAKDMRDHSTHLSGVPHHFHVNLGSPAPNEVWLSNPNTGQEIERHFVEAFEDWVSEMKALLEGLRSSAIATMRSHSATNGDQSPELPLAG